MRKFIVSVLSIALITIAAGGAALYWLLRPVTIPQSRFVEINRGTGTREIAEQLARAGVVRSPWSIFAMRALNPRARLEAGEYEFSGTLSAWDVFNKIRLGQIYYQEVTVPEGSNIFDIAALLEKSGMMDSAAFLAAARNPSLVHDLDALAPSLEGYLFPSTYRVTHSTTAKGLCRMMIQEFRRQWSSLAGTDGNVHRTVVLASLVEKETAVPQERPLVAGVFTNRLNLRMPLQCDPTTVYAALLENRYRGAIHRSDLASSNAYNTYAHAGLPPGPIANPGAQSLKAAMEPANTDALYFVAKGDGSGSHHFSSTLAEHDLAVDRYRKSQH